MSLPLTRRIAGAALLVAAGAAPAILGSAGTANALDLPQTNGLGTLSALDGVHTDSAPLDGVAPAMQSDTTDGAVSDAARTAGAVLDKGSVQPAADRAVPLAARTLGTAVEDVAPATTRTLADTQTPLDGLLGQAADLTQGSLLPTGLLPTGNLQLGGLPLGGLPV